MSVPQVAERAPVTVVDEAPARAAVACRDSKSKVM